MDLNTIITLAVLVAQVAIVLLLVKVNSKAENMQKLMNQAASHLMKQDSQPPAS